MSQNDRFIDQARQCFRRASNAKDALSVARHTELGRQFLKLAHLDAVVTTSEPDPENKRRGWRRG